MKTIYYNLFFLFNLILLCECQNINKSNDSEKNQFKNYDTLSKTDSIKNEYKKDSIFLSFTSNLTYDEYLSVCHELAQKGKIRERNIPSRAVSHDNVYRLETIEEFEMVFNGVSYYFEIKEDNQETSFKPNFDNSLLDEYISYITLVNISLSDKIIPQLIALYKHKYGSYQKESKQVIYRAEGIKAYIDPAYIEAGKPLKENKPDNRIVKIDNIDSYRWQTNPKVEIFVISSHKRLESKSQLLDDYKDATPVNYTSYEIYICYYSKKFLNKLLKFENAKKIDSIKMKNEIKNKEKNIIKDI